MYGHIFQSRWLKLIAENRIVFPEDTPKRPMKKRFASELDSDTNPQSTWMDSVGMNTEGTKQMYDLFGKAFFSYTKPESLVKTLSLQRQKRFYHLGLLFRLCYHRPRCYAAQR